MLLGSQLNVAAETPCYKAIALPAQVMAMEDFLTNARYLESACIVFSDAPRVV